jgi:tetratricopeptide (TPR) repeat protein
MLAVAQDAQGEERVRPVVEERLVTFPVIVDRASELGAALGFRVVPSGFFVDADGFVRYRHLDDFDIADPRARWNLERFLAGESVESPEEEVRMAPEALELFARGAAAYSIGRADEALRLWRAALERDPDNFVIRSQIWVAEHPERFYPTVDREWQEVQLAKEGYDKPLP